MPKVSVIVPNYNHARFLHRRLTSIFDQSYRDFEVIFLDDASSDESLDVAEGFKGESRFTQFICNATNSGSTSKQWNRGLSLASGEYIWFAESDDYAVPAFLETMVALAERHPGVGLVHCASTTVDDMDRPIGATQDWLDRIHPTKWRTPYAISGVEECRSYLPLLNTIPNASAVLLRRAALQRIGGATEGMALCGDWATWVSVLAVSDVAYTPDRLNHFRVHDQTLRARLLASPLYLKEWLRIVEIIDRGSGIEATVREALFSQIADRFVGHLRRLASPGVLLGCLVVFRRLEGRAFSRIAGNVTTRLRARIRRAGLR